MDGINSAGIETFYMTNGLIQIQSNSNKFCSLEEDMKSFV